MESRPVVLVDLDGPLDRHRFGRDPVLRDAIPTFEPPVKRHARDRAARWSLDRWLRTIDPSAAAALRPLADGALVLMTERPPELHEGIARRLDAAGFGTVPLHHVAIGEHPAYGKRRIARSVRPALTVEDDLRIAEFLATYGYETILVDDRYNRGPIRSVGLMRIARADLGRVIAHRLELADAPG